MDHTHHMNVFVVHFFSDVMHWITCLISFLLTPHASKLTTSSYILKYQSLQCVYREFFFFH